MGHMFRVKVGPRGKTQVDVGRRPWLCMVSAASLLELF